MDNGCINKNENHYSQCRKKAALYNDALRSKERAAEYLGVSLSSLSNYELGITKVIPADVVIRMADLYNAPQLKNQYCKNDCPIGKDQSLAVEMRPLEAMTVNLVSKLDMDNVKNIKKALLKIAEDGDVTAEEEVDFHTIVKSLEELSMIISEIKMLDEKLLKKGNSEIY